MKAVAIVSLVVAVVAVMTWAIVYASKREAALYRIWQDFARRHAFRWNNASGPWYARSRPNIEGESSGVPFQLDRYVVSNGKSHVAFTRVRARPKRGLGQRLIVRPRHSWLGPLDTLFQGAVVDVGERAFDERMLVRCDSRELARRVLDPQARERVLAFPRSLRVEGKNGELTLRWRDSERDPQVLAAAIELAGTLGANAARA
jgi:hypothetical protein